MTLIKPISLPIKIRCNYTQYTWKLKLQKENNNINTQE